ncbi:Protein HESO1, partial [Mucuna pruriens]
MIENLPQARVYISDPTLFRGGQRSKHLWCDPTLKLNTKVLLILHLRSYEFSLFSQDLSIWNLTFSFFEKKFYIIIKHIPALDQTTDTLTKPLSSLRNIDGSPVVKVYGSFVMDMFDKESDLDLSINFNDSIEVSRQQKVSTLHKFKKKLLLIQREGHVTGLQAIWTARVPIIKVTDSGTGIECDLSVNNRDGIIKSHIIHAISAIDERFRKLSFLMKSWAKAHDINSPKDSTLSSLSIVSFVAFHLQLAIDGKGKLGYLTGEVEQPSKNDLSFIKWKSENSLITAWLINSMEPAVGKPYLFLPTAKDNSSQIFDLKTQLWLAKQGDHVTTYYNLMMTLWQKLDQCYEDDWENPRDIAEFRKREENDRVYMFLAGLNRSLDEVRGRILGRTPLPVEVFSEVRGEESRRKIMLNTHEPSIVHEPKSSTLPLNWKKKSVKGGCAFQTTAKEIQEPLSTSETNPFTKEQLEHLYKIFSPKMTTNPSCSLAQKGTYLTTALSTKNTPNPWIIDSGATDHMIDCSKLFSSYSPCAGNKKFRIADGTLSGIAGSGSIPLSPLITFHNVLHVPNSSCNLLSIIKLTLDMNCRVIFYSSGCKFEELALERMIGSAKEVDGLYIFEDGSTLSGQT